MEYITKCSTNGNDVKMVWVQLAYKEYILPFRYWKQEGSPGGRDWVWLTALMSTLLTFVFLLLGSFKGLVINFVDVLIGNIEGHGVPIVVMPNVFREGGESGINSAILCATKEQGYEVHPYRLLDLSPGDYIELTEGAWDIAQMPLNTWAVYKDNPLWVERSVSKDAFPLEIVVNRVLFQKYFNYDRYREGLKKQLLPTEWKKLPERLSDPSEPIRELWLNIRSHGVWAMVPFKITWVDRIPTLEKVALLFPLELYHLFYYTNHYSNLFFPIQGNSQRIKTILISRFLDEQAIHKMASQLQGNVSTFRGDIRIVFRTPVSEQTIKDFAHQDSFEFDVMEVVQGDTITHDQEGCVRRVGLPISRLPENNLTKEEKASLKNGQVFIDITGRGNGFPRALVFLSDRAQLSFAINQISNIQDQSFSLAPLYRDALNQFGFLNKMIENMQGPYALLLCLALLTLLGVHISTITGHRRHYYGLLLAKGMVWWEIYGILWLQSCVALVLGAVTSLILVFGVRLYLQYTVVSLAADYRETFSITDFNLVPLTYSDYLLSIFVVLFVTWMYVALALFFMPLRRKTQPSLLFGE